MTATRTRQGGGQADGVDVEAELLPWPGKRTTAMPAQRKPAEWPGKVQAKLGARGGESPELVDDVVARRTGGNALDGNVRDVAQSHLGADLGHVRVHSDPDAQAASAAIGARAFTHGSQVFLGAGESPTDLRLMAHELTHVVQQGAAGRQGTQALTVGPADHPAEHEADAVAARAVAGPAPARLVDQTTHPTTGQLTRDAFLAQLRPQIMAAVDAEVGMIGATIGCPYIERWFAHFGTAPAAHVERVAQRFSGRSSVADARDYIPAIVERLRQGVRRWNNGEDVNADLAAAGIAGAHVPPRPQGTTGATGAAPALQRKPAAEVVDRLGAGQPLDPSIAARFSSALGHDVSGARIHTGEVAARMASSIDAAAFTVGKHVAFAARTFQPGTVRGDALLAHELAHVAQQQHATDAAAPAPVARRADDAEIAREAVATESAEHEADAGSAGAGVISRLYSGAKSVLGKAADAVGSFASDLRLQRCGGPDYERQPQPPAPQVDSHLPMPITVGFAGDRFTISFEGDPHELVIVVTYAGPHRASQSPMRLPLRQMGADFTGVQPQPFNASVTQITDDSVTVDLLGDHSRLAVLHDHVAPGFYLESRVHTFDAAITAGYQVSNFIEIDWFAETNGRAPAQPNQTTDPAIRSAAVSLGGWPLALHAQRLGTTNQVQLRLGDSPVDELVSFDHLDHVTLTVLVNTGRDLKLDLDGDRRQDVWIVHTIEDASTGRIHHLRSFTTDGLLIAHHQIMGTDRGQIPPELDERTHQPDTSLEWPVGRPPAQGDVPGELPAPVVRPGGITELRIDSDGARRKDVLLRFHAVTTDPAGRVSRVRIDMVQISSSQVASQTLDIDAGHVGQLSPLVTDVADGMNPLVIELTQPLSSGQPLQLRLPPPTTANGRTNHTILAGGRTLAFDLPAETTPVAPLVQARPDAAPNPAGRIGGVSFVDLQVGERRDTFRFTAEQTPAGARFSIAGLEADGTPFTGFGVALKPGVTVLGLTVVAGDPRQIAFDLDGDGRPDVLVNDRYSQPTQSRAMPSNIAEPVDVSRQHIMTVSGPSVTAAAEHPFFIFAGRWYQRYGFGPDEGDREAAGATGAVAELQRQRGEGADVTALIDHFAQAVATQRFDAIQQGVITQELYDSWRLLFETLTQLRPSVLPTKPQPPTTPDAAQVNLAAMRAGIFAGRLAAVTASGVRDERYADGIHSRRDVRRINPYTGEVDDVTDVYDMDMSHTGGTVLHRAGANLEIESAIRAGNWQLAYEHYTTLRDGLDHWIADEMARRFGPNQSASWQYQTMHALQQQQAAHPDVRRVQAVFVADDSYSNHSDYNTYRQMPLYLLIWREGTTWHIKDLTRPDHPYDHTDGHGDATNPTHDLFKELDDAHEFPKGVIRYDIPNGFSNRVTTTERKTWVDYVAEAAMILGAVAVAATGIGAVVEGAAAVAVFTAIAEGAAVGAGLATAVSAGGDIYERAQRGDLDATSVVIDLAQVVAGVFTAGAASSRILVNAARTAALAEDAQPFTRFWARAAAIADKRYVMLGAVAAGADVVTVVAMVPQTIAQLQAVASGPGSDGDRTRAVLALLGNLAAQGALTALSVRGAFHELRVGRPNIIIDNVNGIPIARAAGIAIGGVEIRPSAAGGADGAAAARWNAHGLTEGAQAHIPEATAMTGDPELMRWYRGWMEHPRRVDIGADGRARVHGFELDGHPLPEPMRERLQTYLDDPRNALSLYERSFVNADRIRNLEQQIPGLDLDPASASWRQNRQRIIQALGGDDAAANEVRRYEAARLGAAAPNPAVYRADHAGLTAIVPETELARIRELFAGYDVYVTGAAPRARPAGTPPPDVPDIDVFVVVPPGTDPELMQAIEARANSYRVRTDPEFNAQYGHGADHSVPLDAKVMTPEQFAGFATTTVPAQPGQRARTPATYHNLGAGAAPGAGTREASAQLAVRVMGDQAAAERVMTALGDNHARLGVMAAQIGDGPTRDLIRSLGEERFGRYAAAAGMDAATLRALTTAVPDVRLRALEGRGLTPQQIADAWRTGGAPAIHMAETLADAELTRIMTALGSERFGRYAAVAGMDGATLGRIVTEVPAATLLAVEAHVPPRQVVAIFRAGGAAAMDNVNAALTLAANGRLQGFADWLAFADGKGPADLHRTLGELSEAQRQAAANPASIVRIGGDQQAPHRVSDPTQVMPSFDITVETPAGHVESSVEVTTVDNPVAQPGDITAGIRHAGDKVQARAHPTDPRDANPIPGTHEVAIRMQLAVGDATLRGGRVRRILPSGEVQIIDGDGVYRTRPGNPSFLFPDIEANLNAGGRSAIANLDGLHRITLIDQGTGAVLAVYNKNAAGVWELVH